MGMGLTPPEGYTTISQSSLGPSPWSLRAFQRKMCDAIGGAVIADAFYVAASCYPDLNPDTRRHSSISIVRYDQTADSWTTVLTQDLSAEWTEAHATATDSTFFISYLGLDWGVLAYTPTTTSSQTYPGFAHGAMVACGGLVYGIGGMRSDGTMYGVDIFDPQTGSWSTGVPSPTPVRGAAAACLNSKIYLMGGFYQYIPMHWASNGMVQVFDINSNTWSSAPPAPTACLNSNVEISHVWHNQVLLLCSSTAWSSASLHLLQPDFTWVTLAAAVPWLGQGFYQGGIQPDVGLALGAIADHIYLYGGYQWNYTTVESLGPEDQRPLDPTVQHGTLRMLDPSKIMYIYQKN